MKRMLMVLVCALLAGCDYTVPLVTAPNIEIDAAVLGLWQTPTTEGRTEQLLVLPLDKHDYLVSYPAGGKEAMFARACLCRIGDKVLVQLKWFGTGDAKLPEDDRVFQFASYSVQGDRLAVRLLNTDVVSKSAASTEELAKLITAKSSQTALFNAPMAFKKVSR